MSKQVLDGCVSDCPCLNVIRVEGTRATGLGLRLPLLRRFEGAGFTQGVIFRVWSRLAMWGFPKIGDPNFGPEIVGS